MGYLATAEDYVLTQGAVLFKTVFETFGRYDEQQCGVPKQLKRYANEKEGVDIRDAQSSRANKRR